jgi:hypothetical protein
MDHGPDGVFGGAGIEHDKNTSLSEKPLSGLEIFVIRDGQLNNRKERSCQNREQTGQHGEEGSGKISS